jgi:hypothetical protein
MKGQIQLSWVQKIGGREGSHINSSHNEAFFKAEASEEIKPAFDPAAAFTKPAGLKFKGVLLKDAIHVLARIGFVAGESGGDGCAHGDFEMSCSRSSFLSLTVIRFEADPGKRQAEWRSHIT